MDAVLADLGWAFIILLVFVAGAIFGVCLLLWLDVRGWLTWSRPPRREIVQP